MKCPQTSGYKWKLEDNTGVCYQNADGWVDWEYPNNDAQESLGYYLDTWPHAGWIQPAAPGYHSCGISSGTHWKDTTSVRAYSSTGTIRVYYKV